MDITRRCEKCNSIDSTPLHVRCKRTHILCIKCANQYVLDKKNDLPCRLCGPYSSYEENISKSDKFYEFRKCPMTNMIRPPSIKVFSEVDRSQIHFTCPICFRRDMNKDELIMHCSNIHNDKVYRKVCPICITYPWGNPNYVSVDVVCHMQIRH